MRNLKKSFDDFLSESQIIRRWRSFFKLKFFPYLQKITLSLLLLIVVIFVGLKFFKPDYLQKINTFTSKHFLRYLHLDNYNFGTIKITGNKRVSEEQIKLAINKAKEHFGQDVAKNNNETLMQNLAKNIKENLPWINQISITRTLPNTLNIAIVEYEPFAVWENNDQKYVIDKDGNKIKIDHENDEFKDLVALSGNGANVNAKSLFNIFVINPEFSTKIYSATWVGNRRWDIRFENGLLVKLPTDNLDDAWRNLIKIYNNQESLNGLQAIDLRIERKIYLKYLDSKTVEVKNLKL